MMIKAAFTPLTSLRVSQHQIPSYEMIPNTSLQQKPLLIYHSAFQNSSAGAIEAHLSKVGVVTPQWRFTMYKQDHFHSSSHEVLCVATGQARLCFGGETNPERIETVVGKGDVIVVPAGVAHRLLEDHGGDFQMVGCYPKGMDWDMCYGKPEEEEKIRSIKALEWFTGDPVYGKEGPVMDV